MPVERGYGPPDKNNKIELETRISLSKKIRPISNNEGIYSQVCKTTPRAELGQMIIYFLC